MRIPASQAKNLVVVDPVSGMEVPHVKEVDPEMGWVEVYSTMPAVPGYEMQVIRGGVTEVLPYTFIRFLDSETGQHSYGTRTCYGKFDVVMKATGEVIHEVLKGGQLPERIRLPHVLADETREILSASVPPSLP